MELPFTRDESLRWLFLDLNAYFASVEQAESPELLGRPVGVAPTPGDSATIIAASYEAKPYGIRTGTKVGDARRLCPDIEIVPARPPLYVRYHEQILNAVQTVLPIDKVCSIDELRIRLLGEEREPERAIQIGQRIKAVIRAEVAPSLTCSIGVAPNAWLAKLATELRKPDGFEIIHAHELPDRLRTIALTEFSGINRRMQARLMAAGIFNGDDLIAASPEELKRAFGSVIGERWWYLLRGYDLSVDTESGKSLGHSHVLPPELRNDAGCRSVLLRLTHKATARLRAKGLWATHLSISVSGRRPWRAESRIPPSQDALSIAGVIDRLWATRDFSAPLKIGITFTGLQSSGDATGSLFEPRRNLAELGRAVDTVNQKFGKNAVYLAALDSAKEAASEKIAFNKTWLFSEGKGDNDSEE